MAKRNVKVMKKPSMKSMWNRWKYCGYRRRERKYWKRIEENHLVGEEAYAEKQYGNDNQPENENENCRKLAKMKDGS